jgi:outer membrane protein assembly factor BamD (BamD/ComL family)
VRTSTKPLADTDPLSEEVSLLDEARRQLVNHDGPAAMRAASTYLTRFPAGRLGDEAQVLRVDAAFLIGGRSASAPLAEAFLREHPDSPHAPALRELLRSAATPSPPTVIK